LSYLDRKDRTVAIGFAIILFLFNLVFAWLFSGFAIGLGTEIPTFLYVLMPAYLFFVSGLLFLACKHIDYAWAYSSFVLAASLPFVLSALVLASQ
jgi:hypothetical protein